MADSSDNVTELGFVEKVDSCKLKSIFFPSKVGGKPAWLAQVGIPSLKDLTCSKCGKCMHFLLQVYAPREEKVECFHRTIYLFICRNDDCYLQNSNTPFKSFRSQLSRNNNFFDYESLANDMEYDRVLEIEEQLRKKWGLLCLVCGYPGEKRCSACKVATYCSKEHQIDHWKNGHKRKCSSEKTSESGKDLPSKLVLPEYEIITEPEDDIDVGECQVVSKDVGECQVVIPNDYQKSESETFDEAAFAEISDKQFEKFKKTVSKDPDQILRYRYGGSPLWISNENQAGPTDIPNCPCGAKRVFEFQVLPQLLNHLDVDSLHGGIDFGTLLVYTCSNNCQPDAGYAREFIWKQDFSDINLK